MSADDLTYQSMVSVRVGMAADMREVTGLADEHLAEWAREMGLVSGQWKFGDVALVNGDRCVYLGRGKGWEHGRPDAFAYPKDADARPLLVIDPEDREQVERLTSAHINADEMPGFGEVDAMQAALRSLLPSPKPDEPQGLGAVVRDAEGRTWVRVPMPDFDKPWYDGATASHCHWQIVAAVEVLSEGVTP